MGLARLPNERHVVVNGATTEMRQMLLPENARELAALLIQVAGEVEAHQPEEEAS